MKRSLHLSILIIAIVFTFSSVSRGQSLEAGYSHSSVILWGKTESVQQFNITLTAVEKSYSYLVLAPNIRFVYLNLRKKSYDLHEVPAYGEFYGIFLLPLSLRYETGEVTFEQKAGAGRFDKPLVNKNGKETNFLMEFSVSRPITSRLALSLSYTHISNLYRGVMNPGIDNVVGSVIYKW